MFVNYSKLKFDVFQIMNEAGKIVKPEKMPQLAPDELLKAYHFMCLSRQQEEIQTKISDGGKNLNFLASAGQEAIEVAYAMQVQPGIDWLVLAYRNNAAWITAGVPIENIYLYWLGNEFGSKMPTGINVLPVNIPIGTQYSHAVGIAFAEKFKKNPGVVITTIGDGGTSEGEVYEAMNFAALHKLPVVFIVENNQWSLTTPRQRASVTTSLAIRGVGMGIDSIQVDGNDFFASYVVVAAAIERAKSGLGPTFIEAITYRRFAHSASDIKKDYYDATLEAAWLKKDPLDRMRNYLISNKLWNLEQEAALIAENEKMIYAAIERAETNKATQLKDIFQYTYQEMPLYLQEQLQAAQEYFGNEEPK